MTVFTTPWVRAYLAADPVEAMAIEERKRAAGGTLRLFGKSARGPWTAIYHAPGDVTFDGSRGSGNTVLAAVVAAMGRSA